MTQKLDLDLSLELGLVEGASNVPWGDCMLGTKCYREVVSLSVLVGLERS